MYSSHLTGGERLFGRGLSQVERAGFRDVTVEVGRWFELQFAVMILGHGLDLAATHFEDQQFAFESLVERRGPQ